MKLQPKVIKLHAKIITPIHIDNWVVLDRMDYFLLDQDWNELQTINKKWLVDCAKSDKSLFQEIIKSIENWDYKKLEELKLNYYNDDIWQFIIDEISVWNNAKNSLLNTWNKSNQWFIKRFSRFWLDKELFIPWSTLKWIFRTISLFSKISEVNNYWRENKEKYLEELNKWDAFKETFSFLSFEDINVNNLNTNLEIQEISSKNKPPREWQAPKPWISQVMEVIKSWEFEININDLNNKISYEKLSEMLRKYSDKLIARESQILNNIWFKSDLINILKEEQKKWYFPIKIWMFKKSLSYKLFWDEMIEELNRIKWKEWLNEARKKWIWDKMIYLDENQNPVWWIAVKILDDNN